MMNQDPLVQSDQVKRAERYREMVEKLDPNIKKRRITEELDGRTGPDGQTPVPGLRENLFSAVRQALAQDQFVEMRAGRRDEFADDETTEELWDRDEAIAVYNQGMYWLQVEYLEGLVKEAEAALEQIASAGLPETPSQSRRGDNRRRARVAGV